MITVKWNITLSKSKIVELANQVHGRREEEIGKTNFIITTKAHTLREARNKMQDLLKCFLDDGWDVDFTSVNEIIKED